MHATPSVYIYVAACLAGFMGPTHPYSFNRLGKGWRDSRTGEEDESRLDSRRYVFRNTYQTYVNYMAKAYALLMQ
jgi:hypothetical protein